MNEKKNIPVIAFSSQKGGVGKTSLALAVATYFHFIEKGYNVGLIDADPQQSISSLRKSEENWLETVEQTKKLKEAHEKRFEDRPFIPIIKGKASHPDLFDAIKRLCSEHPSTNLIIVDFPYHSVGKDVVEVLSKLDAVIIPFNSERFSFLSSISFGKFLKHHKVSSYFFWNNAGNYYKNPSSKNENIFIERKSFYKRIFEEKYDAGIFFDTVFPTSDYVSRDICEKKYFFRSTLFPAPQEVRRRMPIASLVNEIKEKILK